MNCFTRPLLALVLFFWLSPVPHSLGQPPDIQLLEEQAMQHAVSTVAPMVVRIETLGGLERVGDSLVGTAPTTGLVVSEDGYIISSTVNFIQKPTSILVVLPDGSRTAAKVVARDRSRKLVLLKVESSGPLQTPTAVPSDEVRVGQWAIAVGRTYDQQHPNLSVGIVSAKHRIWGKALQTDAKISPSNYGGPLVDIRGRVLGILVPLSPQSTDELAGSQWYDSGIGFAIPLVDIQRRLEKMKRGDDIKPGLLGVSLRGNDLYSQPVIIAAAPAHSPAAKAGLKADDTIVAVDQVPIQRQAQFRQALGSKDAGDTVQLTVLRGERKLEFDVELVDRIKPFQRAFIGILPQRAQTPAAPRVRFVFPDSPAAQAGILVGDRIESIDDHPLAAAADLQIRLAQYSPGETVSLRLKRDDESQDVSLELAAVSTSIPDDIPPVSTEGVDANHQPPVALEEIKLPEESHRCLALIPQNQGRRSPPGLIVWLHRPGEFDEQSWRQRWEPLCQAHHLIVLAPQASDPKRWLPTETDFVRKAMDEILRTHQVDRRRIALFGRQAGGTMAWLVTLANRDLVRGLVVVDAAVPRQQQMPQPEPLNPLTIYLASSQSHPQAPLIRATAEYLDQQRFPVTLQSIGKEPRRLNDTELAEVMSWFDCLDRL